MKIINYFESFCLNNSGISLGSLATGTPALLKAAIFSAAVPEPLEMIAPAYIYGNQEITPFQVAEFSIAK